MGNIQMLLEYIFSKNDISTKYKRTAVAFIVLERATWKSLYNKVASKLSYCIYVEINE